MSVEQLKRSCNRKALAAGALALIVYTGGRSFGGEDIANHIAFFLGGYAFAEATTAWAIHEAQAARASEESSLGAIGIFSNVMFATFFTAASLSPNTELKAFSVGSTFAFQEISNTVRGVLQSNQTASERTR